jgi:hypothetical protein
MARADVVGVDHAADSLHVDRDKNPHGRGRLFSVIRCLPPRYRGDRGLRRRTREAVQLSGAR